MILSREQWGRAIEENNARLALNGMSNLGKTVRSDQLEKKKGFAVRSVDDGIAARLGLKDMSAMAEWMGQPFERSYPDHSAEYLAAETALTREAIEKALDHEGNFVLDTTGSVIYLPEAIQAEIKRHFLVVGLVTPDSMLAEMKAEFARTPKPLIWGKEFVEAIKKKINEGIDPMEAVVDLYPQLLASRQGLYANLADVLISGEVSRSPDVGIDGFLQAIAQALPSETDQEAQLVPYSFTRSDRSLVSAR